MTTAKRTRDNTRKAKQQEYLDAVSGAPTWGEIVTWDAKGPHQHKAVVQALADSGLDPALAREFAPKNAWTRAARKLSNERLIEEWKADGDEIMFQFTRSMLTEHGIDHKEETKVTLDKQTGRITCPDESIRELAQQTLDRCMEERTTSDVSSMVKRMFQGEAELVPLPNSNGGVFFVPVEHSGFTEKMHAFLSKLGAPGIGRWPIAKGTAHGDGMVCEAVSTHLQVAIAEYETAVAEFGATTSIRKIETTAERIKLARAKVESFASYLGEERETLEASLERLNEALCVKVDEIAASMGEPDEPAETNEAEPSSEAA